MAFKKKFMLPLSLPHKNIDCQVDFKHRDEDFSFFYTFFFFLVIYENLSIQLRIVNNFVLATKSLKISR